MAGGSFPAPRIRPEEPEMTPRAVLDQAPIALAPAARERYFEDGYLVLDQRKVGPG